ncbi:two-component sensor histidine kinase [Alkalihalophilus pseudofirmus OF4]|uniref:histidine kinase n=1 Tax=Alkalihalophilus pseudofirmus (strain ATCC BAA-2126 / JCM 17055 / OF4) TaxID=398511 RepID=D3FTI8_ALKPO|nr:sensor histidine kinase [Alkalihalophilus pseudofirmus]ADC50061.1 two-component sensor histidine kinase [Alkalihalophilus pseudofirmus OF4]WEG17371.1 sensor histidine kinase [Alkalihalophilus pseudofirmus]
MQNWYNIFPKNTGLSVYVWIIFCLLPFYFIFRSSSLWEIIFGILMIVLFFVSYRLSFITKGGLVYLWVSIEMAISIGMTLFYGYVYFAIFLAFFIGNIQSKGGFITLYVVHLVTTIIAVILSFFTQQELFLAQFPFIIISVIGVILLPFNTYNRNKREKLEGQLEDANKRISQLIVMEERQRIARDLHDTLGQKLSLIGLKSDLARKLIDINPESAKVEISDINQTARTALKEVREMVSDMRGTKLEDEIVHLEQILKAAEMEFIFKGNAKLSNTPLLVENVVTMCLKEAVTNVIKHSEATSCKVVIKELPEELQITVQDNGIGINDKEESNDGTGLLGIRERLEFVNGSLEITAVDGTTLDIRVPNVIKQSIRGD